MYKVLMQTHSGNPLYAAEDGHPQDRESKAAILPTKEEAESLKTLVMQKGYAEPTVMKYHELQSKN